MKIAIFTDILLEVPGGIGSSIIAAKKALEAAGHQVLIFCPGWHAEKDQSIIVVPTNPIFRPNGAPWGKRPSQIIKWLKQNHPEIADFDLFHAHYEGPVSLAAIKLARDYQKPLIQTLHGREDKALSANIPVPLQNLVGGLLGALQAKSLKKIAPKLLKQPLKTDKILAPTPGRAKMWQIITRQGNAANLVLSPSEHFAKKLQKMGLKTPIKVLPNGIDDDIIPLSPQPRTWHESEPLKILWNSRLSREKRFLPLLEALKIAGEKGLKYQLTAFGTGNDQKKAQKIVKQHGLNVKFMGSASRAQILRESTHSHLSATTSYDFDTQGLTIIEAEVCGTPALICDPDLTENLAPGSFILTASPEPEAIASALLAITPAQITAMSEKMLAHRHSAYQSTRLAELLEVYRSVL